MPVTPASFSASVTASTRWALMMAVTRCMVALLFPDAYRRSAGTLGHRDSGRFPARDRRVSHVGVLGVIGRRTVFDNVEALELVLRREPQHADGLERVHHEQRDREGR